MIKVKFYEIVAAADVLDSLFTRQMETKLAFRFKRIISSVGSAVKPFDRKRSELFVKYGVKAENGEGLVIPEDKKEVFTKELQEDFTKEVELDVIQIPYSDLEKSTLQISPKELAAIEKFVSDVPSEFLAV
jgi:hypothetical protein